MYQSRVETYISNCSYLFPEKKAVEKLADNYYRELTLGQY